MSRQIWLAPILNNNRERLLECASEVLVEGPTEALLYIAASRPLLELAAGRLLDGERVRGVWGSLPVHLFRGFARFVLATAVEDASGLPPRIAIDQEELPLKRSLISQIIKRLARDGKLKAIASLAHRDGCINSVVSVIGEIQRAGKTAAEFSEIVEARARDFYQPDATTPAILRQVDFDREVAMIYSEYAATLDRFALSEDDADQLRALEVLRGEVSATKVTLPWLAEVRLLVLDSFFDFTPVQGEMLRLLIPQIPNVIVNLNRDERNAEIFRPFEQTVEHLASMAEFEVVVSSDAQPVAGSLSPLRERLFNPAEACKSGPLWLPLADVQPSQSDEKGGPGVAPLHADNGPRISLLECGDRQTEIREIAKQIKRLVLIEGFKLRDIALVVRERASYEDAIGRIFDDEGIPCSFGRRIAAIEIPAVRAAVGLIDLLVELQREEPSPPRVSDLADLIKSGYFRLSADELVALANRFDSGHSLHRRDAEDAEGTQSGSAKSLRSQRLGGEGPLWDADELENAIAYVGGELRVDRFLARARQLTRPATEAKREAILESETDDEDLEGEVLSSDEVLTAEKRRTENSEFVDVPIPGSERRPKFREVDPAVVGWSALVVERISQIIAAIPRKATARELRDAVMRLFDQLEFSAQVRTSEHTTVPDRELPALALDLRGLESLRRAISAATRSIEMTSDEASPTISLGGFLDEVMRSLRAESLMISRGDPDGLKVLEATDVRGLRFRAVFIVGLVEGGFPLRASRDWIYPHEERERLKPYGLTLEDISPDTLLKEEHYFYQAACRATERLYLTRPLVLEDGSETVACYYIEELSRAIGPAEIKKEIVRSDFDGHKLFESSRESELAVSLVRQEERHFHSAQATGNFEEEVVAGLLAYATEREYLSESVRRRVATERDRGGRWFGRFDGVISNPSLIESLRNEYNASHVFSASELSLYGKCPFKFFAEKVLKLEPRGEAALDLTALDAGSLLHEALRRFFERHRGERLADLDRVGLRRELGEVADEVFNEHERAVPPLNPRVWSIDRKIRKLLLEQVLDYELTVQEKTRVVNVRPAYFELAFGMRSERADSHSTEQRLEFQRGPGDQTETVGIRGQIDRVDVARDGTAIAYDYKLSKGASIDDLAEGRALQLHIYLAALERLFLPGGRIAGGGYYTMKGGGARRNKGLYRAAMKAYTAVRETTASTLSESEWQRIRNEMETRVWEFIDGIRAGQFVVDPSAPDQSCPHCDYSAVCRYEKFRIRGKRKTL